MMTAPNRAYAAPVPDVRGLRIPERTLELLRDLVASHAGIHYDDARLEILRDRIVPLAIERGFDSLLDYYYLLKYDPAAGSEWPRVMDALSVQETYFWREADHFAALAGTIVPRLIERQQADDPYRIDTVCLR
jgi:chemotaxis protein methyltransferase CheR